MSPCPVAALMSRDAPCFCVHVDFTAEAMPTLVATASPKATETRHFDNFIFGRILVVRWMCGRRAGANVHCTHSDTATLREVTSAASRRPSLQQPEAASLSEHRSLRFGSSTNAGP